MGLSNYLPSSRLIQPGVCTSSTRPASPFEGQAIYETDTDMMAIYNGTAWRYIAATTPTQGTVLQVVNATYSTQLGSSSSTPADTGLTATITPKSSSSKILVNVCQNGCYKNNLNSENRMALRLLRDSTVLSNFSGGLFLYTGTAINLGAAISTTYLDSPATASAVTYKTQYWNPNNTNGVNVQADNALSMITLMELAG
jgi:hypothetical protein